jgi:hypothetical protein
VKRLIPTFVLFPQGGTACATTAGIGHLANPLIPLLANVPGRSLLYAGSSREYREVQMELALQTVREQAQEKTPDIGKRVCRRHGSGQHRDYQGQYLKVSGSRRVSPLR